MAPIDEAITYLESSETHNIAAAARIYGVQRSTLSKRFNGKTGSLRQKGEKQRLLSDTQEETLVKQIWRLCEWCLPPTPAMVRLWASSICGTMPGKNWSAEFRRRHEATLDCRYLNTLDIERHQAESESSLRQYFAILKEKRASYSIRPGNCYNMDEKGFLLGHLQKVQRVFPKALMARQKLLGSGQDGNREWITVIATICADGTSLPPALIYKAVSGELQDTWLQDYKPGEHACWFASSSNGWTCNELGVSWLQSLFNAQTITKAKRDWRLLILDGHGSHCTIEFLDWCKSHRILVAVFPPHTTHRLQPLDVGLFGPLAAYYSQEIDHHTRLSHGLVALTKRDFFKNFFLAYDRAFTESNIKSSWQKTGLEPFDPEQVLKIFKYVEDDYEQVTPHKSRLNSCLTSPTAIRTIRKMVAEEVSRVDSQSQKVVAQLGSACLSFAMELTLAREREKGYIETIQSQKAKKRRGRPFTEELRAEEGLGVLFFSPSKIARAKELQAAKDIAKEQDAHDRVAKVQDRATQKAQKALEVQQRREDRVARAAARKAAEALKRAEKQRQNEVKKAAKRAVTDSQALNDRPTKQQKTQKQSQKRVRVVPPLKPQQPVNHVLSRSERTIKRPAQHDEI